jgi:hypothetical protein
MSLLAPLRSRVLLPSTSLPTLGRRTLLTPPTSSPQPDSHLPSFARSSQAEGYSQPGLRMILFGKPGSGKGTLSQRVLENFKGVSLVRLELIDSLGGKSGRESMNVSGDEKKR